MAVKKKAKTRSRRRTPVRSGRSTYNRRLTWREIRSHFETLRSLDLNSSEAKHLLPRLKRARSQLVPILGWMLTSPYELERDLAQALIPRLGGKVALDMLLGLIDDVDVYDAFKPALRELAATLTAQLEGSGADEDDEDDEGESSTAAAADDADEDEDEAPRRRRRRADVKGERPRSAGRRRGKPGASLDPRRLFIKPGDDFLEALDGPLDDLISAFWKLDEGRRISFVDRLDRIDDPRLGSFLSLLLASDQRPLVHSALIAIDEGGYRNALEGIEALLARDPQKTVRSRAEAVRDRLKSLPPAAAGDVGATAEGGRRRRPRPKEAAAAAPSAAELLGLALEAPREPAAAGETLAAEERLPRLRNCLATPVSAAGRQTIHIYRQGAGGQTQRLSCELSSAGWESVNLTTDLPPDQDRLDLAAAAEAGAVLVEVTMAYGRRRVQQAAARTTAAEAELPAQSAAAVAWLGTGKRSETEDELPAEPVEATKEQLEALLENPLFADWAVYLSAEGQAVERWFETRNRRDAGRLRKVIIDDVITGWLTLVPAETLAERLRQQAWLLRRAGQPEAADQVLSAAAQLLAGTTTEHALLRELVYRSFAPALDRHRDLRRAAAEAEAEAKAEAPAEAAQAEAAQAETRRRRRPRRKNEPAEDVDTAPEPVAEPEPQTPADDQGPPRQPRRRRGGSRRGDRRGQRRSGRGGYERRRRVGRRARARRRLALVAQSRLRRRLRAHLSVLRARANRAHRLRTRRKLAAAAAKPRTRRRTSTAKPRTRG